MKFSNRLKRIKENGKTYLRDEDTGEKVQVWSDETRANNSARKKRDTDAFKIGTTKYSNHTKVSWNQCEARIDGKLCNEWEEVHPKLLCLKGKFRCYECIENDRSFKK
jgi:hypothetical protein